MESESNKKHYNPYIVFCIIVSNFIVLLVVLNVALFFLYFSIDIYRQRNTPAYPQVNPDHLRQAFPYLSEAELKEFNEEHHRTMQIFAPFVGYRPVQYDREGNIVDPSQSKYIKINPNGYREIKNQSAWPVNPKDINIFFFGGSTGFGYGAPFDKTIASYLQEFMRSSIHQTINIYNFGRPAYTSTQERLLFEDLLLKGNIPTIALFFHGLNDSFVHNQDGMDIGYIKRYDEYDASTNRAYILNNTLRIKGRCENMILALNYLPMKRLADSLKYGLGLSSPLEKIQVQVVDSDSKRRQRYERLSVNQEMIDHIALRYRVFTLHIIQPIPVYKYDIQYHFLSSVPGDYFSRFYEGPFIVYRDILENSELRKQQNVLWLADIQENMRRNLYIDDCHYTAEFNQILAEAIGREVLKVMFQDVH
ncbi:MAG TPA: hypothetical protein PLQ35_17210 [bacterium]|mgnify:CR=1 FL=1|nr:hypothetical protein [bacterium]HQL64018.1 hypothetical protein [bacterium]